MTVERPQQLVIETSPAVVTSNDTDSTHPLKVVVEVVVEVEVVVVVVVVVVQGLQVPPQVVKSSPTSVTVNPPDAVIVLGWAQKYVAAELNTLFKIVWGTPLQSVYVVEFVLVGSPSLVRE